MNDRPRSKGSLLWLLPLLAILGGTVAGGAAAIANYQSPEMSLAGHVGSSPKLTDGTAGTDAAATDDTEASGGLADFVAISDGEAESTRSQRAPTFKDGKPRVYLPAGDEHDFGAMARNEERSHSFKVQNIGQGPLTLNVVDTTCKCTVGSLEKKEIASGETVDVTLTWEAKSYSREFRQSARVETNDQQIREIVFSVYGKVIMLAAPDTPSTQVRIRKSEGESFSTKIYGYRDDDLLVTSHEFLREDLASFFDIRYKPIPEEQWEDPAATSCVLCEVDVKPGLPLGQVTQGIKFHTNKSDIPPIAISVDLQVISDISIFGKGFVSKSNLVHMGQVDADVGKEMDLQILVKGEYKDDVNFSLVKADPEGVLTAEFGEPEEVSRQIDGVETVLARKVPLKIIVKKGAYGVSRMGNEQNDHGVLTIDTQHPEVKQFDVFVKFFVKERN